MPRFRTVPLAWLVTAFAASGCFVEPSPACSRYVACIDALAADRNGDDTPNNDITLDEAELAALRPYDPETGTGSCWVSTSAASACTQTCVRGLDAFSSTFGDTLDGSCTLPE